MVGLRGLRPIPTRITKWVVDRAPRPELAIGEINPSPCFGTLISWADE